MPKVAQDVLEEFGRAVKRARALKGWQLSELSKAMERPAGKSFLSNIEKGKRSISPTTVGRLIKALTLDESWIDKFLQSDVDPDTEETKTDRDADRLLRLVESNEDAPGAGQELLMLLASEYAEGSYIELRTAYTGLRGALQAAADMRARGNMPDNTGAQFQAVMAEVTRLNDEGDRDGAAAALDGAQARVEQEYEAIFTQQLNQDRLRNRPADAAKSHIASLHRQAPAGGVWNATRDLLNELRERGETEGDPFELGVALELAEIQWKKAKKPQKTDALSNLARCHFSLGKKSSDTKNLKLSLKGFEGVLKLESRKSDPRNWGIAQNNLGNALSSLGERKEDSSRLLAAVDAYEKALMVQTKATMPADWAMTQDNLGIALRALSEREEDNSRLLAAVDAYKKVLTVRTKETTPAECATTQNNLGIALRVLGEREEDRSRLLEALDACEKALTIRKKATTPADWAASQQNLGVAHRWLGDFEKNLAYLTQAKSNSENALQILTRDAAPFQWAQNQWNLADLAIVRYKLDPDPAHLVKAQEHVMAAREMFEEGSEHQTHLCDDLLAKMETIEANL